MLGPHPRSNPHFSAYCKDNLILVQFIIVEFIETYQLILQMEALFQESINSQCFLEKGLASLIQISALLLKSSSSECPFSCHWTEGSLTKLKMYCKNFCSNLPQKEKRGTQLYLALHQTELAALHYFTLLSSLQTNLSSDDSSYLLFRRAFNALKNRFKQVVRLIPRLVSAYCHNENILLCLLRKKSSLTKIYGADFLAKHFKCPLTPRELMNLLLKQYQKKGFSPPPLNQNNADEEILLPR